MGESRSVTASRGASQCEQCNVITNGYDHLRDSRFQVAEHTQAKGVQAPCKAGHGTCSVVSPAVPSFHNGLQAVSCDDAGIQLLAREGDNKGAAVQLKALVKAVERQEPRNPALWLKLAQPYARLAGTAVQTFGIQQCRIVVSICCTHLVGFLP